MNITLIWLKKINQLFRRQYKFKEINNVMMLKKKGI